MRGKVSIVINSSGREKLYIAMLSLVVSKLRLPVYIVLSREAGINEWPKEVTDAVNFLLKNYAGEVNIHIYRPSKWDMLSVREFAARRAGSKYLLYLDDDVFVDLREVLEKMLYSIMSKNISWVSLTDKNFLEPIKDRANFSCILIEREKLLAITKDIGDREVFKDGLEDTVITFPLPGIYLEDTYYHLTQKDKWYKRIDVSMVHSSGIVTEAFEFVRKVEAGEVR